VASNKSEARWITAGGRQGSGTGIEEKRGNDFSPIYLFIYSFIDGAGVCVVEI